MVQGFFTTESLLMIIVVVVVVGFNVFVVQGQSMFAGSGGRKRKLKCGLSSLLLLLR